MKVSQHSTAYLKVAACGRNDTMHHEAAGQALTEGGRNMGLSQPAGAL